MNLCDDCDGNGIDYYDDDCVCQKCRGTGVSGLPDVFTIEAVDARVAAIRHVAKNGERAHIMQDRLLFAVLRAIADGCADPALVAAAAVKVHNVKFQRWYA